MLLCISTRTSNLPCKGCQREALGSLQAVYWAKLAQAHLRSNDVTGAKQVFSRSMLNCLSMDVWMTYMQFIKQVC